MYGAAAGGRTPLAGGTTPMLGGLAPAGLAEVASKQRDRAAAAGVGDCELVGAWVDKGVRLEVVSGAHAGRKGVIKSTGNGLTLTVLFEKMTSTAAVSLKDCLPVTGDKLATNMWVRVLGGEFKGARAKVEVVDEDNGEILLQLGESLESIPSNICIAVEPGT